MMDDDFVVTSETDVGQLVKVPALKCHQVECVCRLCQLAKQTLQAAR